MPASKRRFRSGIKKSSTRKSTRGLWLIIFTALIIFFIYLLISKTRSVWDNKTKLSVAVNSANDAVNVVVLDPQAGEITTIIIPGNTQVEVARNLGKWQLASVWRLGKDEKIGGRLLSESVTNNFSFPIALWADKEFMNLVGQSPIKLIGGVVEPFDTRLTLWDKLRIAIFSLKTPAARRVNLDLAKSNLLKRSVFVDGEEGYVVTGLTSQSLLAVFADPLFYKAINRVLIVDAAGTRSGLVDDLARTVEVLGAKVTSITKTDEQDTGCIVKASEKEITKRLVLYFGCEVGDDAPEGTFDIEIILGNNYQRRL